ncbi:MAG: J domain-containing protein, partial [Limnohabitans sp.]
LEQLGSGADPQVQALAEVYRLDEEELAEERAQEAQRLREQIEAALGQPIHKPSQYQTPEEMMAAGMRQWQRQQQADEERKAAKRAARKALKKPAAHAQAQAQQMDAKSAIRTIFRQLASALHPDREPDAQERARKTALMSEVNAAYEKNDLSTLLRLQMQTALSGTSEAGHLADDRLAGMCLLLKEQAGALEDDLAQLEAELTQALCVPVSAQLSEAVMTQALQRLQAEQRQVVDGLSTDLRRIQNEAELKRWLKEQSRAFKAASE